MKRNHSIRRQILAVMTGLVAGTVLLCWLLNTTIAGWYYTKNKQKSLLDAFIAIDTASREGILTSSDFDIEFERICSNGNITIMVIQPDRTPLRSSAGDIETLRLQFLEIILGIKQNEAEIIDQPE